MRRNQNYAQRRAQAAIQRVIRRGHDPALADQLSAITGTVRGMSR